MKLFGYYSLENLDIFGRYILMRQQCIFRAFDVLKSSQNDLHNIFKQRSKKFYSHSFYDHILGSSTSKLRSSKNIMIRSSSSNVTTLSPKHKELSGKLEQKSVKKNTKADSLNLDHLSELLYFKSCLRWVEDTEQYCINKSAAKQKSGSGSIISMNLRTSRESTQLFNGKKVKALHPKQHHSANNSASSTADEGIQIDTDSGFLINTFKTCKSPKLFAKRA